MNPGRSFLGVAGKKKRRVWPRPVEPQRKRGIMSKASEIHGGGEDAFQCVNWRFIQGREHFVAVCGC